MTGPPSPARTNPEAKLTGLSKEGGPASRPAPTVSFLGCGCCKSLAILQRCAATPSRRCARQILGLALGLGAVDGLPGCLSVSGAAVAGGAGDAYRLGAG